MRAGGRLRLLLRERVEVGARERRGRRGEGAAVPDGAAVEVDMSSKLRCKMEKVHAAGECVRVQVLALKYNNFEISCVCCCVRWFIPRTVSATVWRTVATYVADM